MRAQSHLPVGRPSDSQDGSARRDAGYSSEGVDQTAGSPTSYSSGAGSLLRAHPVCRHVYLHDRVVLHPLLLLWETEIPGLQSAASAANLKLNWVIEDIWP